ncbi:MAG: sulfite reductase subunit C, partial [Planctomycetia bacterium]|nr:sulfite reductase subunit C [Planctomycetia bacterium]
IPGIKLTDMDAVNKEIQSVIEALEINQKEVGMGYPSSGTRNIQACPGSRLCPFGCYDTTAFAQKMEKLVFPNDRHVKIAFTGCSNDCGKVRMADFGIIGMTEPQYDPGRCVGCEQCINFCRRRSVGALSLVNGKVVRDTAKCIGCGVCVAYCPTRAWTRSKEHYFRLVLLGRTGKRNPRLAEDFIKWCDEESILKIVKNSYAYIEEYIDPNAVEHKEHIGYIVDRTGFEEFFKYIMEGVELPAKAEVSRRLYWGGNHYDHY